MLIKYPNVVIFDYVPVSKKERENAPCKTALRVFHKRLALFWVFSEQVKTRIIFTKMNIDGE